MGQAFKKFHPELIQDLIIAMKNFQSYNNKITDRENQNYLVKLLPMDTDEFLVAFEKI